MSGANARNHTPGPWRVRSHPTSDCVGECFVEADRPKESKMAFAIEVLGDDYGDHCEYPAVQRRADAQLISAAPDLLDACELAMQSMDTDQVGHGIWELLKEAIEKATGG